MDEGRSLEEGALEEGRRTLMCPGSLEIFSVSNSLEGFFFVGRCSAVKHICSNF